MALFNPDVGGILPRENLAQMFLKKVTELKIGFTLA